MGIRPPRRRRRSPGSEVRDKSPARKSGAGLRDRVRGALPRIRDRSPGSGFGPELRRQGAGAGFRVPHRTVGSRGRKAFSAPRDRMFPRRRRRSPGSGFGKSAGRPAAGPAVPGPGSGSAAGSVDGSGNRAGGRAPRRFPRPGFVVRGRVPWTVPGGMRRKAFSGLGPGRLPKAFRLRRIFPRTEAFSAAHERRRGNPRSAFPSGGGPGSAGSRVPGAGAGCGTFLRRPHPAAENRGNPASPVKKETFQTGFVEEL